MPCVRLASCLMEQWQKLLSSEGCFVRRLGLIAVLLAATFSFSLTFAQGQVNGLPKFIQVGTAGMGGAYYPIGIAIANILTKNLPTQATAVVTGGAVANIGLIQNGTVNIALTQSAVAYKARKGMAPFKQKNDKICGLFGNLTQGVFQIAVRPGSGIKTLQDLKGKRVSLGPAGGLGVELAGYVFQAAGFSVKDVKATYISYNESASSMADGNLDAMVIQTALPNPALAQLEATGKKFTMLSLPQDVITKVTSDRPYYEPMTIPASVYHSAEPIHTLYGANMVVVSCSMSTDAVYAITKALFQHIGQIQGSHPAAKHFSLAEAPKIPIPLHPGAAKYFREVGVLK